MVCDGILDSLNELGIHAEAIYSICMNIIKGRWRSVHVGEKYLTETLHSEMKYPNNVKLNTYFSIYKSNNISESSFVETTIVSRF